MTPLHKKRNLLGTHPAEPSDIVMMNEILGKPWRIAWLNFLAGVSRGVGLTLGVSLIAGVAAGLIYKVLAHVVDIPWVGSRLAQFIAEVQRQTAGLKKLSP